jgi:hypothetical protein
MQTPKLCQGFARAAIVVSIAAAGPCWGADAVPIYDATELALGRYTVVKRLGVGDWRSAFRIRGYPDLGAAQQSLVNEAARAGADGVINLTCFDQTDALFKPAGYYCYGNAIRLQRVTIKSDERK